MPLLSFLNRLVTYALRHLNFYRIHLLAFTFTPLIFSAIFYASNGQNHISYIDALFNSVSAMTVCGLASVDLSSLTAWQQVILFIQMCLGSPVLVAWITVYVRRHFFAKQFETVIKARMEDERLEREREEAEASTTAHGEPLTGWSSRLSTVFRTPTRASATQNGGTNPSSPVTPAASIKNRSRRSSLIQRLRPEMIRRMDDTPRLINPSGHYMENLRPTSPASPEPTPSILENVGSPGVTFVGKDVVSSPTAAQFPTLESVPEARPAPTPLPAISIAELESRRGRRDRNNSDPGSKPSLPLPQPQSKTSLGRFRTAHVGDQGTGLSAPAPLPRTQTIEFALLNPPRRDQSAVRDSRRRSNSVISHPSNGAPTAGFDRTMTEDRRSRRTSLRTHPTLPHTGQPIRSKHRGYGGFPLPHVLAGRAINYFFPGAKHALHRSVTIPHTATMPSAMNGAPAGQPYFSFDVLVGRNSAFPMLTNQQLEELGGVEYRALNALLWIVAGYHLGIQIIAFVIVAPYMSESRWGSNFLPPALHKHVPPAWFGLFQVISAYTNTGMSLVDQSMVPFQKAYGMIIPLVFLIVAGNTGFPIFLRFTIWVISKLVPRGSRLNETLHFLLDHPRRCFLYLFPSHQTWFLLTIVITLNFTDWFFFLVLDIGNPAIESIPIGTRFAIGLLQAAAVRAAGFGTVTLSALAPAVKVLYAIMMYVSVYPIAMSVRSTNVYEEQSLGIFDDKDDEEEDEDDFKPEGGRVTIWSRYVAMHARKQLSFDMWWLGLALFTVCIIERHPLEDERSSWMTIFNILFELVSAYGTVGLSLGLPTANYSLSGAFRPLSKLIVCAVMLRGRHRGLPVAIDRAVMLPAEFKRDQADGSEARRSQEDGFSNTDDFGIPRTKTRRSMVSGGQEDDLGIPRTRTRRSTVTRANGHTPDQFVIQEKRASLIE